MLHSYHHRPGLWSRWFSIFCICLSGLGCGSAKYEERLGATTKMFNHMHELDDQLQSTFDDDESSIQFRPPRGFTRLPAPTPVEGPDGELMDPELDERQPVYFGEELPGMIAAWKSGVTADDGEYSGEAYLYLLSNIVPIFDPEDLGFRLALLDVLDRQLGTNFSSTSFQEVLYPVDSSDGFVPQVAYQEDSVVPEKLINELPTEFSLYIHGTGETQVCLLLVMPQKVDGRNELLKKIGLCLQTLKVDIRGDEDSGDEESSSGGGSRRRGGGF